jgi:tetratricopeptide (TPR) repeat protein
MFVHLSEIDFLVTGAGKISAMMTVFDQKPTRNNRRMRADAKGGRGCSLSNATKMDNADLEKLKVSQGKLVPKFKSSVTSYSLTVASNVEEVKLSPLTADSGASYVVKGADSSKVVKLTEGITVEVEVIVTAEDGSTTKSYTVLTRRLSADDATLAQLDVSAGVLQPPFSPLVTRYECSLPSGVDSLTLRVKTEDSKMTVAMKTGEPVPLNPGRTLVEVAVTSVSGKTTSVYTITAVKSRLPPTLQLKEKKPQFECAVCCNLVHLPTRIRGSAGVYCRACLEELTRTNKTNPITGERLEGENWLEEDLACDSELANQTAVCHTATGMVETSMQQIGAKLQANRIEASKTEEPTESCGDCSKKVPSQDVALHKELLCPAKHTVSLPKTQVKPRPWENRLVDESCGSDPQDLLKKGREWETKYLESLPKPGETGHRGRGPDPLECLQTAARCYGTALKYSPQSMEAHISLGLVMEEFFYAEDLFGLKKDVPDTAEEGEAEISSKEEEFLAICQLHGVVASAPLALQLKAVEAEYHSLKEAGQTHKAEHVQSLHAWKSKKALQASQSSFTVDNDSPLFRAKLKFQDACSVRGSDPTACFHLGRLCLLLGDKEEALKFLRNSLAQKPTHSPTRLCLGMALGPAEEKHAKPLLWHGLTQYLTQVGPLIVQS